MQKYKQYCPVARAAEILADRWTALIVRELILGSHRFNEIERGLPGISRSLLASRLRDLEDAGVIERLPGAQPKVTAYHLSEAGRDLTTVIETLGAWGVRWAFGEPRPEELDAGLLITQPNFKYQHAVSSPMFRFVLSELVHSLLPAGAAFDVHDLQAGRLRYGKLVVVGRHEPRAHHCVRCSDV
jgi:DNA-binding HxlR family transcriptional regulator